MPKYNLGDPVWANDFKNIVKVFNGEVPAVITSTEITRDRVYCRVCGAATGYGLDILPGHLIACPCCLRPRRDDYQQHEGLGSRDQLRQPLADDVLPAPIPREVIKAARFVLMYGASPDTIRRMLGKR